MRILGITLGILALGAVVTLLPIKAISDARTDAAYSIIEAGHPKIAKYIFAVGKFHKDPLSTNNWIVLDHRAKRDTPGRSKALQSRHAEQARDAFKALRPAQFAAAEYNLAMFNYKCSSKSRCFKIGTDRFEQAALWGDPLARGAIANMSRRDKKLSQTKRTQLLRDAAEDGNDVAARYLANKVYRDSPVQKKKYALIAAQAGNSDAQAMMGELGGEDAQMWLEKAATNPKSPSVMAALDLSEIYDSRGDDIGMRKWLTVAAKGRGAFDGEIVVRRDGLRWRHQRRSRVRDSGHSHGAAFKAANMELMGRGGAVDKKSAKRHLEYADREKYGHDAQLLLAVFPYIGKDMPSREWIAAQLAYFDARSPQFEPKSLRPLIENGSIEYALPVTVDTWLTELEQYQAPVPGHVTAAKRVLRDKCDLEIVCYTIKKTVNLPDGLSGGNSKTFIIPADVTPPTARRNHSRYVFLGPTPRKVQNRR